MPKIETAYQRKDKVRKVFDDLFPHCTSFYEKATDEQKEKLNAMLADLQEATDVYRKHEMAWDGQLIDVVKQVVGKRKRKDQDKWQDGVKYRTQEISTFDSVMDRARDIFVFVVTA